MTSREVIELMVKSKSEDEWNENCDKVKAAFDGKYPPYWFNKVILGGILEAAKNNWVYTPPSIHEKRVVTDLTKNENT